MHFATAALLVTVFSGLLLVVVSWITNCACALWDLFPVDPGLIVQYDVDMYKPALNMSLTKKLFLIVYVFLEISKEKIKRLTQSEKSRSKMIWFQTCAVSFLLPLWDLAATVTKQYIYFFLKKGSSWNHFLPASQRSYFGIKNLKSSSFPPSRLKPQT